MRYGSLDDIRPKLDKLNKKIVVRLSERADFPLNKSVYKIDYASNITKNGKPISLFEFSLYEIEQYHGSLGRFEYSDQNPVATNPKKIRSKVRRETKDIPAIPRYT